MASQSTPDDVKLLLSSFIYSPERSQNTAGEVQGEKSAESLNKSRDRKAYWDRVHTFDLMHWFGKPQWLSPLRCARFGWENTDIDVLRCTICKQHISGRLPNCYEPNLYDDCCKKVEESLTSGHSNMCPWPSNPTPEHYTYLEVDDRMNVLHEFRERFGQLTLLKQKLPCTKKCTGISESMLDELGQLAWRSVPKEVSRSAAILALCGWIYKSKHSAAIISCELCNRDVGLWEYTSLEPQDPIISSTTGETEVDEGSEVITPRTEEVIHEPQEVTQGSADVTQESEEVKLRSEEFKQGSGDGTQESEEVKQGSADLSQESEEVKQGSEDVTQGSEDVKQESEQVTQGSEEVKEGSEEVTQGSDEVTHGSEDNQELEKATQGSQKVKQESVEVTESSEKIIETSEEVTEELTDGSEEDKERSEEVTQVPPSNEVENTTKKKKVPTATLR